MSTSGKVPIRFGTYNIFNGRKGGLEAALRGMSQANMDLGILQETKLTDGIYTCGSAGYSVIATYAPSRHRGGVALFLLLRTTLRGGGGGEVWTQCTWVTASNEGATVVHCGGVHQSQGHGDYGEGSGGDTEKATGRGAAGGVQL